MSHPWIVVCPGIKSAVWTFLFISSDCPITCGKPRQAKNSNSTVVIVNKVGKNGSKKIGCKMAEFESIAKKG